MFFNFVLPSLVRINIGNVAKITMLLSARNKDFDLITTRDILMIANKQTAKM